MKVLKYFAFTLQENNMYKLLIPIALLVLSGCAGSPAARMMNGGSDIKFTIAPAPIPDKWTISEKVNAMNDEREVTAYMIGKSGANLLLHCTSESGFMRSRGIDVQISLGFISHSAAARVRFDSKKPVYARAIESRGYKHLIFRKTDWSTPNTIGIREMLYGIATHDRLRIEASKWNGGRRTLEWDISNSSGVVAKIIKACNGRINYK